tara:strand:+ start:137 stop:256 length:120 start_codon:yes stop_codon:yes gene_type:complete
MYSKEQQPLAHTTFSEKEALMRRASKAIMVCRGFYHSVT